MVKKSSLFIRQSVVGLGFLSGIFTAIGIDPQDEIIGIVGSTVTTIYPDPRISSLFLLLPTILLLISVVTAYRLGGIMGLVSVVVAYFAGLALFTSLLSALFLLGAATVLGYCATNRHLLKKVRFC
jgi:hypothetical protein